MDLADVPDPVEKFETMIGCAKEAERAGFDAVWLYDHFHTTPTAQLETTFECWTSMAALARDTKTIKLGQMVTCNNYRPPSLLAKMASGIDVMSHGRLILGIGAGWYEEEFLAYGYEYPDTPERLRMLREALQVIKAMWTQDRAEFEGRYYRLRGAINEPKPVQKPHPPIWVGGESGPSLRRAARFGDAWYPIGSNSKHLLDTLPRYRAGIARLRQLTAEAGRESASVALTYRVKRYGDAVPAKASDGERRLFSGSNTDIVADLLALRDLGVGAVDIDFERSDVEDTVAQMRRFKEQVISRL